MSDPMTPSEIEAVVPFWAPRETGTYLAHTEGGTPLRALARQAGVHASTILRQVRAIETRREDVLVDRMLSRLGKKLQDAPPIKASDLAQGGVADAADPAELTEADLDDQARKVLAKLSVQGTVMAVAAEMDKAVIVKETEAGDNVRRGIVDRDVAEALAVKGWVACETPARISRYRITAAGRTALGKFLAKAENRAVGFAEAATPFWGPGKTGANNPLHADSGLARFQAMETPLSLLSRRRDKEGELFLTPELARAGERLREDFELAGQKARGEESWDQFLTRAETATADQPATQAAKARVIGALRDLGPGLGDAALRCCCFLEGLEATEKHMGWSARSGKIVLRIALQRLKRHYDDLGEAGAMLG